MCFSKPKTPKPGAQPAPPAAAGAESLLLGPTSNDDEALRNAGLLGRLALRVGRATGISPRGGPASQGGGSTTGSVGSGTGGSGGGSSSSGGGSSSGGSTSGGDSGGYAGGGALGGGSGGGGLPIGIGRQSSL